ncbi:MAG: MaoC/PaaZ C-terminal domain-containing protein [Acidimicrobiia bacterium]
MDPAQLVDRNFGPHPLRVCAEDVSDFVKATGDDAERWMTGAPPGFMAVALFVVASELLGRLADRSVIHGEQTFAWHRPLVMESQLQVQGTVRRVRERGGTAFVDFEVTASDERGTVAEGTSLFLVSGPVAPLPDSEQRVEASPEDDGKPGPGRISASRADLVRYAAATRDWNPIHWDHDAAVAAGLPGVVAHGLLQAAWIFVAASSLRPGDAPLATARVRFRNPLLPATPVSVRVEETGDVAVVAVADDDVEYVSARIELTER